MELQLPTELDDIPMSNGPITTKTVGAVIGDAIRHRGVTIAALARDADVRYDFLNAVIHNRERLSIPVALKLGPVLGLEPHDLLVMQLEQKIEIVRRKMASRDHSTRLRDGLRSKAAKVAVPQ
jgi:plasmid maintenance system antidote protein VapI